MAQFHFNCKGKKFNLDVELCDNYFSRARGLMFRKKSRPLLFIFKKPVKQAIHSFFCIPFVAIWFDNKDVIDIKFVKPWKSYVKPVKKFDRLLEIPVGNKDFNAIKFLIQK